MRSDTKRKRTAAIIRITAVSIVVNIFFACIKGGVGFFGHSQALIADAAHSLSDFFSDGIVIGGILAASRPIDESHRYGHGKFETLATAMLGLVLFAVSFGIFRSSGETLYAIHTGTKPELPSVWVLAVAALSICAKEILFHATVHFSKSCGSKALLANAWHHRSDALSSVAVLAGSGGAYFFGETWSFLDPAAGIIVGIMVAKVAFGITKESIDELLERSLSDATEKEILDAIESVPGAQSPHRLRTRKVGARIVIDVHILVDPALNIVDAHDISSGVEDVLIRRYGRNTLVSVHIEPDIEQERKQLRT
ncbi:MAG: cation diffusion facilitator family transporter [Spirochaetota bacterium]